MPGGKKRDTELIAGCVSFLGERRDKAAAPLRRLIEK